MRSLDGATGWLNSEPPGLAEARKVEAADAASRDKIAREAVRF
jgi:hypothetical protein